MSIENPWRELAAIDRKYWPRLEPRFGHCPICRFSATAVALFCGVTWATCQPCWYRWPSPCELSIDGGADIDELPLGREFEDVKDELTADYLKDFREVERGFDRRRKDL